MYSIAEYGAMIADTARIDAFTRALRRVITPESVVVDIGTGTGILALLACQLGARRVYAIEPNEAIHVAREAAAANGYADRIEFLQALSTAVTLPEQVHLIVSDIGGLLPWLQHHVTTIIDARTRFLAPGGTLMPRRDALWMALVEAPELYRRHAEPWDSHAYGLDLTSGRQQTINTWRAGGIIGEQLLVPPIRVTVVDYAEITSPNLDAVAEWTVSRAGTAHGFGTGIDRILIDGVGFSNAPDREDRLPADAIYRPVFFPWSSPVVLDVGDTVTVKLRAVLVGDDYVWRWKTHVLEQGRSSRVKARFEQSTLWSIPLSAEQLHKRSASHVPSLNEDGNIASLTLELMRLSMPLGEIARRVSEQFPSRFPDWQRALTYVSDLSERYGQ
jgi:protein arginine N-methyltransferase 1